MSSKRDLVEAYSFNRRRLVTAFVSGAPAGREVEPVRYGRTLVGGLVLAVLIVAGAAVSGFIKPPVPKNWMDDGLVIDKDNGARFLAYKHKLYPVINTTSARLILAGDDGKFKSVTIPDDKISGQKPGVTIGITGAPDLLPSPSKLINTGWTACTNAESGITVQITEKPAARPATDDAFLASAGKRVYVVTGQHRYALPTAARSATLRALRLDGEPVRPVSGRWIDLVTPGSELTPFKVPGAGKPTKTGVSGLTTVGTPVQVAGQDYVLGDHHRLFKLPPFAYAVYRSSGPGLDLAEKTLNRSDVVDLDTVDDPSDQPAPKDWPQQLVSRYSSPTTPCLLLHTGRGDVPYAELADPTSASAVPTSSAVVRTVEAGRGALARAENGGVLGFGNAFLIDSTGTRYAVGGKSDERRALTSLGYGATKQLTSVPAPWLALFGDGPTLSARSITAVAGQ